MVDFNVTERATVLRSGCVRIDDDDIIQIADDYFKEHPDGSYEDDELIESIQEYIWDREYDYVDFDNDDEESDGLEYDDMTGTIKDFLEEHYSDSLGNLGDWSEE